MVLNPAHLTVCTEAWLRTEAVCADQDALSSLRRIISSAVAEESLLNISRSVPNSEGLEDGCSA
jgi:hypothetical protein